jgi:hypothetical protein
VLHTPGGFVSATESLINYLQKKFGTDIRVFVPQTAMSGGTIMALMAKEIWMGHHSNLGPIDPQFGSTPAVVLLDEFQRAYTEIKADPDKLAIWQPILSQISPTFLTQAKLAIDMSQQIADTALQTGMFAGDAQRVAKAKKVVDELTDVAKHKQHGRHIHYDECAKMGLNVMQLESNPALQDAVLSAHHAFYITLTNTTAAKIIQNQNGVAFVKHVPAIGP